MDIILKHDIENIFSDEIIDFNFFSGKTIFITGATGIIGYNLICTLLAANSFIRKPIKVVAMVRDEKKAKKMYGENENLYYLVGDVIQPFYFEQHIDYLIHAASQTSSKAFVDNPVEVIKVALAGTFNVLELCKVKKVKAMVFLSTMEVYGNPDTEEMIKETHGTNLDTMKVRASYPESKRMCESICTSFFHQYGVPIKVIRLAQTFGPGVRYDDGRVFAEFIRCAIEMKDIVLHTNGTTTRSYLYTADAVTAILTVLIKGVPGEAYNATNEKTLCSIKKMADLVCRECACEKIKVDIKLEDEVLFGYAPVHTMNMSAAKLKTLGWRAIYSLDEMFMNLYSFMLGEAKNERR